MYDKLSTWQIVDVAQDLDRVAREVDSARGFAYCAEIATTLSNMARRVARVCKRQEADLLDAGLAKIEADWCKVVT